MYDEPIKISMRNDLCFKLYKKKKQLCWLVKLLHAYESLKSTFLL